MLVVPAGSSYVGTAVGMGTSRESTALALGVGTAKGDARCGAGVGVAVGVREGMGVRVGAAGGTTVAAWSTAADGAGVCVEDKADGASIVGGDV